MGECYTKKIGVKTQTYAETGTGSNQKLWRKINAGGGPGNTGRNYQWRTKESVEQPFWDSGRERGLPTRECL